MHTGCNPFSDAAELIDDSLDLTVLEAEKRSPALKNRLVGDAVMYKAEDRRWSQVFQRYVWTPLHQKSSECVPLWILSIDTSKKRKH